MVRKITFAFALSALLAAGSVQAAVVSVSSVGNSTLPSLQGAAPGSTYITFEDVAAGTTGPFVSGGVLFLGSGKIFNGSVAGTAITPAGDTTNYLGAGSAAGETNSTEIAFLGPHTEFGLDWGSIDVYNVLLFFRSGKLVFAISGLPLLSNPNLSGNGLSDVSNRYVNFKFTKGSFDTVVFHSLVPNFEVDNIGIAGVPELSTWAMMLVGFGLVGMQIRRRKALTVTSAV
jgi:hypothetical protein